MSWRHARASFRAPRDRADGGVTRARVPRGAVVDADVAARRLDGGVEPVVRGAGGDAGARGARARDRLGAADDRDCRARGDAAAARGLVWGSGGGLYVLGEAERSAA